MSAETTHKAEPVQRKRRLRRVLALSGVAGLCLGMTWYKNHTVAAAEESAQQYIRLNGTTSETYRHNLVSRLLALLPLSSNGRPLAAQTIACVSFPRDRLNDYMANELLKIRNLKVITLFPQDPHGGIRSITFGEKWASKMCSLRDLDLPLSANSIQTLEDRFPKLIIQVMERTTTDARSDVTK